MPPKLTQTEKTRLEADPRYLKRKISEKLDEEEGLLEIRTQKGGGFTEAEKVELQKHSTERRRLQALLVEVLDEENARAGMPKNQPQIGLQHEGGSLFYGGGSGGEVRDFQPTGYSTEHANLGEFIRDVKYPTERRVMSMDVGATGGFMVPDQLLKMILQVNPETMPIGARATTIGPLEGAPDAATLIPTLDQAGSKGILGGVAMQWLAEGAEKTEVEPKLKQIKLEPQELAGFVVVTDKLLRNGGSELDAFLNRTLGNALAAAQEQAFLSGDGVGKPLGILGSPCRIEIPRAGGGAIVYQDLVDMVAVFGPNTWAKGLWLISQSALPQVLTMADPGAGGTLILKPADMRLGTPPSMLGLPAIVSSRVPALGSTADLMLIEPSYYLRKLGSGPFILASSHAKFTENKTILKIFANCDGQPWLSTPMLMEDGVTSLSPFVVLAA